MDMTINSSPLKPDIERIIYDKAKKVRFHWECYFKIRDPEAVEIAEDNLDPRQPDEKKHIFKPLKIINLDTVRKYAVNVGDEITITLAIPLGLWYKILQPYRDQLDMVVKRRPLKETTWEVDKDEDADEEKFFCLPNVESNQVAEASGYDKMSRWALDAAGFATVNFTLLDKATETMRAVSTGAVFRRKPVKDIIQFLMQALADDNTGEDGKPVTSISLVKPDNEVKREHLVIPQGTAYFDVPGYIQFKAGGVYSAGLATYLQSKQLYIFPPYNTMRFKDEEKTLTILKVSPLVLKDVERTFRTEGGRLMILAAGDVVFDDTGDETFFDEGNGVRYTDATKFLSPDMFKTKNNKTSIERKKNNNEFLAKDIEDKNVVNRSEQAIHANTFMENSKLSARFGNPILFEWKNADASLLYPGMPVKVMYAKDYEILTLMGTLVQVHASVQLYGQGLAASAYTQTVGLEVLVSKQINKDEFVDGFDGESGDDFSSGSGDDFSTGSKDDFSTGSGADFSSGNPADFSRNSYSDFSRGSKDDFSSGSSSSFSGSGNSSPDW